MRSCRFVLDVQTLKENRGVGLGSIPILFADDAFEFREAHPVVVGELGLLVNLVALRKGGPQAFVAHHDGVDDAEGVEGVLVLAKDGELAGADDVALLRIDVAGKDFHEGSLAGAVGAGKAVAPAGREGGRDFFEQNFSAVAHGDVADGDHASLNEIGVPLSYWMRR